jgi:hypothetical protein
VDRAGWRILALGLIIMILGQLTYLKWFCPHDLAPDEAHYWDWSRNLDTSYYSKGPLIAVVIRVSTELLGHSPVAVRFPAVLCSAAITAGIVVLGVQTGLTQSQALLAGLAVLTLPGFSALSLLMTIDAPFLACWTWGCVQVHRGLFAGRLSGWLLAGLCVFLGNLTKQTMLAFPASVLLGVILGQRSVLRSSGFWLFLGIGLLGVIPGIIWNLQHAGVGGQHVARMLAGEGTLRWYGPLVYLAEQAGLNLGFWLIAAGWAGLKVLIDPEDRQGHFLLVMALPLFLVCSLSTFLTKGQPNWPAAAYVTGFLLGFRFLVVHHENFWLRRSVLTCTALGVILALGMRFPVYRELAARVVRIPTNKEPCPVRRLDPTARLAGWKTLAEEVDHVRQEVRRELGCEPLIATMTWTVPGELGFYCVNHPKVYSFGLALADRMSQYDVWRPNPVLDAQEFLGRTFVYVGFELPAESFDRMTRVRTVCHRENGVPLASWEIWVCEGFRGFRAQTGSPRRY